MIATTSVPEHHHEILTEAAECLQRAFRLVPWRVIVLHVLARSAGLGLSRLHVEAEPRYDSRRLGADTDTAAVLETVSALVRLRAESGPAPWAVGVLRLAREHAAAPVDVEVALHDRVLATGDATRLLR